MREVITLQTGSFANYVGAHYWNIQVGDVVRREHVFGMQYRVLPCMVCHVMAVAFSLVRRMRHWDLPRRRRAVRMARTLTQMCCSASCQCRSRCPCDSAMHDHLITLDQPLLHIAAACIF
jgi:Misato Segment II tubulin-like domain